ncbi:MAG: flagellar hook-basal body protein [Lachnospiraceae bacterium]|jgi:flagellar hook-associated protein 3 FlgL|nr:flagellar hook-basal body protein [Lachnospiraceae bacterium]
MRVTNASTYRKFTSSVNDVHFKLNKSMNKITSGAAYESAAENPLAYYTGKKIDQQYLDTKAKNTLITDVKNRLYQQELGARDIQDTLSKAKVQVEYGKTATTTGEHDIQTIKEDLMQKVRTIANDLNTQYQDFYVYGGNDVSTTPFSLDISLEPNDQANLTLTYRHIFPGETDVTEFRLKYSSDGNGDFKFELLQNDANGNPILDENGNPLGTQEELVKAMSEQGRMDLGYGDISDHSTLVDTYTGGLNVLTGLNSDAIRALTQNGQNPTGADARVSEALNESPIALIGRAILSINDYQETGDKKLLDDRLGTTMDRMAVTEHTISTVYSDLGNKYKLLEETGKRLDSIEDSLTEQYKDALGADPYEAIMEMFNHQYSYNAALQVGSKLMNSSLFDFVR